ncbi:enolase C-terminal domain-like protein [Blastococcus sp. TML/M2B]|uniref:enolase C-terminal domain-like protein n=1 Tax=Blastococcus sp. TML/M2B TaxID=2798727 RepID=UPI0035CCE5D3
MPPGTSTPPSPGSARWTPPWAWSTWSSPARRCPNWPRCAAGSTSASPSTRGCAARTTRSRSTCARPDDVVVLKVQPLGGVRAALRVAEAHGLPCVVSSALESSVGIAAGVALAAALPELPFACGLATIALFTDDVSSTPLLPVDGELPVVRPEPDRREAVAADPEVAQRWAARVAAVSAA